LIAEEHKDHRGAHARQVRLFGFEFADLTPQGLLDLIAQSVGSRQQCWIATINVQLLCLAERNPSFRKVLSGADVITADGMPIVWFSRLVGRALTERVTGSDLLLPLAEKASAEGWRLFFCGGEPGVCERVAEALRARWPNLEVVGTASPFFADHDTLVDPAANEILLATIRSARPDVLLVAFGSPKQEQWIEHHLQSKELNAPVAIGVGASFDFLIGRQRRAPRWMQRAGLEWVFRMVTQPLRLVPRYARDALTFARLCASELRGRRA
jgi:N-acetylglucosaminyldiphosphoundecaprenol N-acetyl-beta-D-mannosaminyltransferase